MLESVWLRLTLRAYQVPRYLNKCPTSRQRRAGAIPMFCKVEPCCASPIRCCANPTKVHLTLLRSVLFQSSNCVSHSQFKRPRRQIRRSSPSTSQEKTFTKDMKGERAMVKYWTEEFPIIYESWKDEKLVDELDMIDLGSGHGKRRYCDLCRRVGLWYNSAAFREHKRGLSLG